MQGIINWVVQNKAIVLGLLLALSEALALVPSIQANSVFQLVVGLIKKAAPQAPQA
jgi:hypothetical protein